MTKIQAASDITELDFPFGMRTFILTAKLIGLQVLNRLRVSDLFYHKPFF